MYRWLLTVRLVLGTWAMAQTGPFEGTPEPVGAHEVPGWFNDAKRGVDATGSNIWARPSRLKAAKIKPLFTP